MNEHTQHNLRNKETKRDIDVNDPQIGVDLEKDDWANITEVDKVTRDNEILAMTWADAAQSYFYTGTRSHVVTEYSRETNIPENSYKLNAGEGKLVGLASHDNKIITSCATGEVKVWSSAGDMEEIASMSVGKDLKVMTQSRDEPHRIATGGKENELRVWDLNRLEKPTFQAQNVPFDFLGLRVPVWISGIDFIPNSHKIVTGTRHRHARVYDLSTSNQRPVINLDCGEYPITSVCATPDGCNVILANSIGRLYHMDLRKTKKEVDSHVISDGSILHVQCHPTEPILACCGLDRYLRVCSTRTFTETNKYYMKSRLNRVMFTEEWNIVPEPEEPKVLEEYEEVSKWEKVRIAKKREHAELVSQEEIADDAIWGSLKVVKEKMRAAVDQNAYRLRIFDKPKKRARGAPKTKGKKKHK